MYTVRYEDLSNKVYKALKEMILKGELHSGQKLLQEELAERLGVSRTPLLTAFSKLEKEHLVEIIPRRGAFVKKPEPEELIDMYDIRLRLEPLGAREAAETASPKDVAELTGILDRFRASAEEGEDGAVKAHDYAFHMQVMRMSGNQLLFSIISSFNMMIVSNMKGLLKDPLLSVAEHEELLRAIRDRNPDEAESLMFRHIAGSREALLRAVREKNTVE